MDRKDLKEFRHRKQYIKSKLEFLKEEETRIMNITQNLDGMPHAKNKTSYEVEKYLDEKNEIIEKELKQFKEYTNKIYEQLNQLKPLYSTILQEVAVAVHYSYYKTCHLNGEALNEFDKLDKNKSEQE